MVIIEFFGAPGCGKSTLCSCLEERLRIEGRYVLNLQNEQKTKNGILRKIIKLFHTIIYISSKSNRRIVFALIDYLHNNKINRRTVKWALRLLETNYKIRKACLSGLEYALFDEGGIQFMSSMIDHSPIPEKLIQIIDQEIYHRYNTVFFYCKLDLEENVHRLKKRNRKDDRFIASADNEMIKKLESKISLIQSIVRSLNITDSIEIDTDDIQKATKKCIDAVFMKTMGEKNEAYKNMLHPAK